MNTTTAPQIVHRIDTGDGTEIRVLDCGASFNVLAWDTEANAAAPFVFRFPAHERARAIAKAEAMAKPRAVSIAL